MDVRQAVEMARGLMDYHGLQDCNIVLFDGFDPYGFSYLRNVALSYQFLEWHQWPIVRELVLHEAAHQLEPTDLNHGDRYLAKASEIGCKLNPEELLAALRPGFQAIHEMVKNEPEYMRIARAKYLARIEFVLLREYRQGIRYYGIDARFVAVNPMLP